MADKVSPLVGFARAALGQGLGMGWGDEAEAKVRSWLGQGDYDSNVKRIRNEYAQYAEENPWVSGTAEFAGGVAPGVAAMFIPGMQGVGAAQLARVGGATAAKSGLKSLLTNQGTSGAVTRMAGLGAVTGGVSGAGNATEENVLEGGLGGAAMGAGVGAAVAPVTRGLTASGKWLRDKLAPSEASVTSRAAEKMNSALQRNNMEPIDISRQIISDKRLGVPSVVGNASPALTDLTETVAQRGGAGANKIEETLTAQKLGGRERVMQQVKKQMEPGDYYDDLERLGKEMQERAAPAYEQAYAHGEVTDPKVLAYLDLPQFKKAASEVEDLLALEGKTADFTKPTVENLDHIKRGLDALIEKETDDVTGKVSARGRVLIDQKNKFLADLDKAVPDFEVARGIWAGGAELKDAMRQGLNDFSKMDHEEVQKLVSKMGPGQKEAFRTGVARDLYSKVMDPSNNFNAAQRVIGSPETREKLAPLFDSPAKYDLFEAALTREAQLFQQANKALGNSTTARRTQMNKEFEGDGTMGQTMGQAAVGNWGSALTNLVSRFISRSQINDKTASKLADMLMSKDPHEVAAVVQLLEKEAAEAAPRALRAGVREGGITTGTTSAGWPAPVETPEDE
jgi:hypothetical protein